MSGLEGLPGDSELLQSPSYSEGDRCGTPPFLRTCSLFQPTIYKQKRKFFFRVFLFFFFFFHASLAGLIVSLHPLSCDFTRGWVNLVLSLLCSPSLEGHQVVLRALNQLLPG